MAIVQAYQCPYSKRLFDINDKPKYVKHLKKMARTTFSLHKAERYAKTFDLTEFRNSIESVEHLNDLLINNFHKYLSLVLINLDFNVITRYAKEFNTAFMQNSIIEKGFIKDYSSTKGFWISKTQNYSYLGLQGYITLEFKKKNQDLLDFGPDLIKWLGMETHSGSSSTSYGVPHMGYDVHFNAMDWKFVARMCISSYLKERMSLITNWDNDRSWHNYYRILIEKHWPGLFEELLPVLNLYSSLGAGDQEITNLIESKFNIGPIKDVTLVSLPALEF